MTNVINLRSTDITVERKGVLSASVPVVLDALNTLSQVRQTMGEDDLRELAESILAQGQYAPGVVVALTPTEVASYVAEINEWSGKVHQVHWLTKIILDGEEFYLVVVAGHRRLQACKIAAQLLESGQYTSDRFTGEYLCDIHFGLSVDQALAVQFHENRHQPVPIHEEVAAAWRTWRFLRKRNPRLTIAAFAKTIGRTSSWVRNMLRFCELPESVQQLIQPNGYSSRVSYQLLVQHARLLEAERRYGNEYSEQEVHAAIMRLLVDRVPAKKYAKIVSSRLRDLDEGQGDFLFGTTHDRRPLRKVALPHLIQGAHAVVGYWQLLEKLLESGAFGDFSPYEPLTSERELAEFSPHSPINLLLKIVDQMEDLLPHLVELAKREKRGKQKLQRAMKDLEAMGAVLRILAALER